MRTTKRSLLVCGLSLLLCVAMLAGTTYAWFTDSVTSANNKIQAGTLNIDLGIKAAGDADYVSVKANPDKVAFNYDKWEPGYTEWVNAKVSTTGNLALKYTMKIVANGEVSALADVIDVYYAASEVAKPAARDLSGLTRIGTLRDALNGTVVINDTLIPGSNVADFATLALHMQETAGNAYQGLSIGTDFSLQILATQYTYESDAFDDQYDKYANGSPDHPEFDGTVVTTAVAFSDALAAGQPASLTEDIQLGDVYQVQGDQDVVINGNGNTLSSAAGTTRIINLANADDATVTLNSVDLDASGKERAISIYGSENAEVNVNNSDVIANMYAINLASNSPNAEININDTTVTGWCAVQTWSANAIINIDNSTLIGLNDKSYNADGWNNFSTIVINEPAVGSVITIRNSRIEANQTTGNKQTFVSFRAADGATVVFENCTFWKDGVQITDMQQIVNNISFTSQEAVNNSHLTINGVQIL